MFLSVFVRFLHHILISLEIFPIKKEILRSKEDEKVSGLQLSHIPPNRMDIKMVFFSLLRDEIALNSHHLMTRLGARKKNCVENRK